MQRDSGAKTGNIIVDNFKFVLQLRTTDTNEQQ